MVMFSAMGAPTVRGYPGEPVLSGRGGGHAWSPGGPAPEEPLILLQRHQIGDWGDVGPEDWRMNDRDLREGERLFSVYELDGGRSPRVVYVITEWGRSVTTILLSEEY